jgi:hypothetical protein
MNEAAMEGFNEDLVIGSKWTLYFIGKTLLVLIWRSVRIWPEPEEGILLIWHIC